MAPDRIALKDEELEKCFDFKTMVAEAQSPGVWVEAACKGCNGKARWAIFLGEYGEIGKSERNALLAHAKAHDSKTMRMRRLP